MKFIATTLAVLCLLSTVVRSQHTSEDFKDAAGCGPFPLYIGLGYTTSKYSDFSTVGREFVNFYDPEAKVKRNMRGANAIFGATVIPKKWPYWFSLVLEGKYVWIFRQLTASSNTYDMVSNQLSLGGGLRYSTFPFVFQVQYQRVLYSRQSFNFDIGGIEKAVDISSGGNMLLARASVLDPAGSDGGFGVFFEYGCVFLERPKENEQLTGVIRAFNESFSASEHCTRGYRYFSIGVIVPLALRMK